MNAVVEFDTVELRKVLGSFVTGVTVITTVDSHGKYYGLTANSFSSVSLDPPLILWSQASKAPSHAIFSSVNRFAINILAEDQIGISNHFATSSRDKFSGISTDIGDTGVPLLRGCSAWLECSVVSKIPGGDHTIYIGQVRCIRRSDRKPLVFGGGRYLIVDPHDLTAPSMDEGKIIQAQLHAVRIGTRAMARLVADHDETMALAVWGSRGPTITAWEPSSSPISARLPVGLTMNITTTATGIAMAAHLPYETTQPMIDAELAGSLGPEKSVEALRSVIDEQLVRARRDGIAARRGSRFYGEDRLINIISVPVVDERGQAVVAFTAVGDASTFEGLNTPLAEAMQKTARDISERLGYRGAS